MFDTLDDVVRRARELATYARANSALEEQGLAVDWTDLDDQRAEFVYELAQLEVID